MDRVQKGGIVLTQGNKQFWQRNDLPQQQDDVIIVLEPKYHQNPDLLAFDAYGSSKLEWLILQFNNITDPWKQFVTGSQIRLMTVTRALSYS